MKRMDEQMGFDDLMMKDEGNDMKFKQPVEIVKHPNIKRVKTVSFKIKTMKKERIMINTFKFKHKV